MIFFKETCVEIYCDLLLWRSNFGQSDTTDGTEVAIVNYRDIICKQHGRSILYHIKRNGKKFNLQIIKNFTSKVLSTLFTLNIEHNCEDLFNLEHLFTIL